MKNFKRFMEFKEMYTRLSPSGQITDVGIDSETKLILMEAENHGVTYNFIPNSDIISLTYNNHHEFMRRHMVATNYAVGFCVCANKALTKSVLQDVQLPVAKGYPLYRTDSLSYREEVFNKLTKPLVVKPAVGTHGIGVKLNVTSLDEYNKHIDYLFSLQKETPIVRDTAVLVEETIQGNEYRVIATRDKLLAVMYRQPASVVGDGQHTIQELIDIKNTDPMRNFSHDIYPHIKVDADMRNILTEQKLTTEDIPQVNQKIALRRVSNIMAGGDAYDVTDEVHPSVAELAVRVTRAIPGIQLTGIDFMTTDITKDQAAQACAVIEINKAPEFAMHDFPMHGKKREVAKEALCLMFPELRRKRLIRNASKSYISSP